VNDDDDRIERGPFKGWDALGVVLFFWATVIAVTVAALKSCLM